MAEDYRSLNASEKQLLEILLAHSFPGQTELLNQAAALIARRVDDNGSLSLRSKIQEPAPVKYRVPIEGSYSDRDGVTVHVLLHVVDGCLNEMEVYKDDASQVGDPPFGKTLELFCPTDER